MSARVKNMFLMKTDTINTPEIILVKGKNIRCTLKPLLYIGLTREKQKTLFTECCNSFIIIRNKSLKKQKVRDQVLQLKTLPLRLETFHCVETYTGKRMRVVIFYRFFLI